MRNRLRFTTGRMRALFALGATMLVVLALGPAARAEGTIVFDLVFQSDGTLLTTPNPFVPDGVHPRYVTVAPGGQVVLNFNTVDNAPLGWLARFTSFQPTSQGVGIGRSRADRRGRGTGAGASIR